jgi:hypothetical protein
MSAHNPQASGVRSARRSLLICTRLVAPLVARFVRVDDYLFTRVGCERIQRILELEMNTRERFQHYVSRELAVMLVKSVSPSAFFKERISGRFPFRRVR